MLRELDQAWRAAVNNVVPLDELVPATMDLARLIARQDGFALRLAKQAVNHTMDTQGFTTAIDAIFVMHHLGQARAALVNDGVPSLAGLSSMKDKGKRARS